MKICSHKDAKNCLPMGYSKSGVMIISKTRGGWAIEHSKCFNSMNLLRGSYLKIPFEIYFPKNCISYVEDNLPLHKEDSARKGTAKVLVAVIRISTHCTFATPLRVRYLRECLNKKGLTSLLPWTSCCTSWEQTSRES